jgi:excinuclease ABC subunit C
MKNKELQELLDNLPLAPGVYLMKNHQARVIYVGKAKNLKNRVRQYFAPATSDTRHFVKNLAAKISTIDTVITATEKEAILLEYNLIHRHMPRYNIRLTDDKRFLHLRLDSKAAWPRLQLVRQPGKDGAQYFGPYHSAKSARETLKLVNRHFGLRNCKESAFKNRTRPCLQYQIRRCPAPCTLEVDESLYRQQVEYVRLFLDGKREDLIQKIKGRMEEAASSLNYETAAVLRDQIEAVEAALAPQRVSEVSDEDRDIVGMFRLGSAVAVVILNMISGRLMGMTDFYFKNLEFPDDELLSQFLVQHYRTAVRFPDEILVQIPLDDTDALSEVITEIKGAKVRVYHPRRGKRVEQVNMAVVNARNILKKRTQDTKDVEERLLILQKKLGLKTLPRRIECVDIAHFAGTNTVGAISTVTDASVDRSAGRIYRIKSVASGDDFGAMHEVLTRRFTRAKNEEAGWQAPDLLLVDGGKGQLNIALKVLEELGIYSQPVAALAKERSDSSQNPTDRVFLPGRMNSIPLRVTSPLVVLTIARDEAHRLANHFQAKSRQKRITGSKLDSIPGIGAKTKNLLLKQMGSVKNIEKASIKELQAVSGIGPVLAGTIFEYFNNGGLDK